MLKNNKSFCLFPLCSPFSPIFQMTLNDIIERTLSRTQTHSLAVVLSSRDTPPSLALADTLISYYAPEHMMQWARTHVDVIDLEDMKLEKPTILLVQSTEHKKRLKLHDQPFSEHLMTLSVTHNVAGIVALVKSNFVNTLTVGQVSAYALSDANVAIVKTTPGLTINLRQPPRPKDEGYDPDSPGIICVPTATVYVRPSRYIHGESSVIDNLGDHTNVPQTPLLADVGRGLVATRILELYGADTNHLDLGEVMAEFGFFFYHHSPVATRHTLIEHGYHIIGCVGYTLRKVLMSHVLIAAEIDRLLPALGTPLSSRSLLLNLLETSLVLREDVWVTKAVVEPDGIVYRISAPLPAPVVKTRKRLMPKIGGPEGVVCEGVGHTAREAEEMWARAIVTTYKLDFLVPLLYTCMEMEMFENDGKVVRDLQQAGLVSSGHLAYHVRKRHGQLEIVSRSLLTSTVIMAGSDVTPPKDLARMALQPQQSQQEHE